MKQIHLKDMRVLVLITMISGALYQSTAHADYYTQSGRNYRDDRYDYRDSRYPYRYRDDRGSSAGRGATTGAIAGGALGGGKGAAIGGTVGAVTGLAVGAAREEERYPRYYRQGYYNQPYYERTSYEGTPFIQQQGPYVEETNFE